MSSDGVDVLTREAFMRSDGSPLRSSWIGLGRTAIILRDGENVIKVPKLRNLASASESRHAELAISNEMNRDQLRNELEVFERLGDHSGIIKWKLRPGEGLELPFLKRGDLYKHMRDIRNRPIPATAKRWIQTLAEALCHCHERRVLVVDLALRNILLDNDNNVVLIDFADSILLPEDVDMDEADEAGASVQTDMFQFSLVALSILTWKEHDYDLFATPPGPTNDGDAFYVEWPPLELMPCTSSIPFGELLRKCWLPGGYRNMSQVRDAIKESSDNTR